MSGLFSWSGSSIYPGKDTKVILNSMQDNTSKFIEVDLHLLSLATWWHCWSNYFKTEAPLRHVPVFGEASKAVMNGSLSGTNRLKM